MSHTTNKKVSSAWSKSAKLALLLVAIGWIANSLMGALNFTVFAKIAQQDLPLVYTKLVLNYLNPFETWNHGLAMSLVPFVFLAYAISLAVAKSAATTRKAILLTSGAIVLLLVIGLLSRDNGISNELAFSILLRSAVMIFILLVTKHITERYSDGLFDV